MMRSAPLNQPKGPEASRLRKKKFRLLAALHLPEDALLGSLAQTRVRCGKPNCRCARDEDARHSRWLFTFMAKGKKRVESVPAEWVEELSRRLATGRAFKESAAAICAANAELWVLERKQRGRKKKKKRT